MLPLISIIVPCYNQAQYLPETLESVLAQTLKEWECVIVNDGSPDNTLEIANEYAKLDKRFIVVDKPNGGLADARNVGIRASHGKYILPLDSDDKIGPEYAYLAVKYFEEHPDTKLVYCKARYFGDRNEEWILPEFDYQELKWTNSIFCSSVYKRSDYELTLGYDSNMRNGLEDWDFLLSFLRMGDNVYCIPIELFYYRKHGVSMISETKESENEVFFYIIEKHIDIYREEIVKLRTYRSQSVYYQEELIKILNSKAYKLGSMIVRPFQIIMNLFK